MKIGIDLGGSHIGIGVVNNNGKILEKQEIDLKFKENDNIEKFIKEFIINTVTKMSKNYEIEEVGVASPGTPKKRKNYKFS